MTSPIVSVEKLSKAYSVYKNPSDLLKEVLTGRKRHDDFWALKDISFSIKEKQRLGVIGPNGSGKSTLLKILTGHLPKTSGQVQVNGNVSAMLSLNTVLNPEDTGLSNIRFNLLLNGSPKSEIDGLVEDIIDFTELGQFIYAPVKTYSSGMNAKLAFAITTAIKPEILIIDEVLSVGDAYFMGKATKRMIEMCDQGKGLIFVSHSNSAVQMLCDTVLWLDNGGVRMFGPAEQVLNAYEDDYRRQEDIQTRAGNSNRYQANTGISVPGEMNSRDVYRIRLRPYSSSLRFEDTHYIRKIVMSGCESSECTVDLSISEQPDASSHPVLDFLGSEWGGFYTKSGNDCRILSSRTGRNKGGQIILPAKEAMDGDSWNLGLEVEYISTLGTETLGVEILDYRTGKWVLCEDMQTRRSPDGWSQAFFNIEIPLVAEGAFHEALAQVEKNNRPDVEISSLELIVDGKPARTLVERQKFLISVELDVNRLVNIADVGLKIMRSDGVYVFWQSSGLEGENLNDLDSVTSVVFHFEDNYFCSGDYQVSAYVANGWNYPENYPYSEVYDRKVGALKFSIKSEFLEVDFGAINQRVAISYETKSAK